ncbi:zinc ribbon domain-containing protein [Acetanaerobacterium elongatum]|uniref:Zinc-ribbon domain-containing protein n=1 Tax=Acetanaerobacterium elongatum TaxID=258515 RepID=A0A1H0C5Z1_9FIRM|nr:zinc ribbon domain-containing protein [Acetanaerobacterium elongatum]SDN53300.1 zinc-ribbon domain-containing protein [Acetanaerobacterium elongatum]
MFCPKCATINPDDAQFCKKCGQSLVKGSVVTQTPFTPQKGKWYTQTWATVLFLILFFPVGLTFMWIYRKNWNMVVKIIITAFFALFVIVRIASTPKYSKPVPANATVQNSSDEVSSTDSLAESSEIASIQNSSKSNSSDISSSEVSSAISSNSLLSTSSKSSETSSISESSKIAESPLPDSNKSESSEIKNESSLAMTASTAVSEEISVISITSPVSPNENASLTIQGVPNTEYSILVYYSSGASKADGLEKKMSDDSGQVTWSWKIGGKTKSGSYRIVIKGGNKTLSTSITVV